MNIQHIKLLTRISITNNISQAGKELGLSPAVASSYITKLEDTLGVKLIYRTTRKVSLTEEGEAFLPHAEDVLNSIELARSSVGTGSFTPQGTLRVAAPSSFARMHLTPALKQFSAKNPDLRIDFRLSDSMIDMVEGGFDVAIRDASLNDSTLIARKLAADKRIICASPQYLEKFGTPKIPSDLKDHVCVNLTGLEVWSFKTASGIERIKTNTVMKADNGEMVRDVCCEGLGLTLTSTWCSYEQLISGKLIEVLADYPLQSDTAIWAVYPSSRLLAPKVRAFIDFFNDYFGDEPYWEKALI